MAMFQNVLFVRRKLASFVFPHPASVKKLRQDVPNKMLRSSSTEVFKDEGTRPSGHVS